jgi:hypothetical protein
MQVSYTLLGNVRLSEVYPVSVTGEVVIPFWKVMYLSHFHFGKTIQPTTGLMRPTISDGHTGHP